MSVKCFISSDIHGFFDEWMVALKDAGFDINNKEHIIIVCGDLLDRGEQPIECLKFVNKLYEQERAILIRGNHELLLSDALKRGEFWLHDIHNGTAQTCYDIANLEPFASHEEVCEECLNDKDLQTYLLNCVNYAETDKYVFCHSWVPVTESGLAIENWEDVSDKLWQDAMWVNPFQKEKDGLNNTGKIIVHGHWGNFDNGDGGSRYPNRRTKEEFDKFTRPFYHGNAIGLDGIVVLTHRVPVLVIDFDDM